MNTIDFTSLSLDREKIPQIRATDSQWKSLDYWGALKVRWSIGRNQYRVTPGLYKLGMPSADAPVFVTANYKLSFDVLRKSLTGFDVWILVLDTKGVNVWCAAGKGSFGSKELIHRINFTELGKHVKHRKLILPQLGAPGVAAHEIKKATGFKAEFGPVRAQDLPDFIRNNYQCTESMRTVRFETADRLKLAPVEISNSLKYLLLLVFIFIGLAGITSNGYQLNAIVPNGLRSSLILLTAYLSGTFLTPVLLPWLPFRMFSIKGMVMGGIGFAMLYLLNVVNYFWLESLGWLMISLSIASFLGMNFTGASTYTSLSGVRKEMALFVPIQIITAVVGFISILISKIFWS